MTVCYQPEKWAFLAEEAVDNAMFATTSPPSYKDGYFYYCGRGDDMLKVGGIWVSPIEVEEALLAHPAVFQAAVVAYKDESDLSKPKAYVALKPGYEANDDLAKEIQVFVKMSIAPYKFPRKIEFIKESL